MCTLESLNFWMVRPYENLTYPHYQPLLRQSGQNASVVAIGAKCGGAPRGLVLAEIAPDGLSAAVHSLFVDPSARGAGVGTSLLRKCEVVLRDRGCRKMELVYVKDKDGPAILERVLDKLHWAAPGPSMFLGRTSPSAILQAPWLKPVSIPDDIQLFAWVNLPIEEKTAIRRASDGSRWYPMQLTPFREESLIEPANSIGLRYRGQVYGWMITHRIAVDTVRYTSLFVREELRARGCGLLLLSESIFRQITLIGMNSFGVFGVYCDNKSMVRFLKRSMAPYVESVRETWSSSKAL